MLASFFVAPSSSLIIRDLESKMGCHLWGLLCMFLQINNFFYSGVVLMQPPKSLLYRDKVRSCFPLGFGIGVYHLQSVRDLIATLAMDFCVLVRTLIWSISTRSDSIASRFLEYQYNNPISYPSITLWYMEGSRCCTTMRFTRGVDISWSSGLQWDMIYIGIHYRICSSSQVTVGLDYWYDLKFLFWILNFYSGICSQKAIGANSQHRFYDDLTLDFTRLCFELYLIWSP